MKLSESIKRNKNKIEQYIYIGKANWNTYVQLLEKFENTNITEIHDEKFWTFLLSCGYAVEGKLGIEKLTKQLTNVNHLLVTDDMKIWLEVLPYSPREYEGNTNLDFAIGTIENRYNNNNRKTQSGICLKNIKSSWLCFCEMKWFSDISLSVKNDLYRNQLIRIIENALTFQDNNNVLAENVFVTLVTPEIFIPSNYKSRLYSYKYDEYKKDYNNIIKDLDNTSLKIRNEVNWKYPKDISKRIINLKLNWISYESLFSTMPYSTISDDIKQFFMDKKRDSII